jgi:Protein of unknown function (DUF1838)
MVSSMTDSFSRRSLVAGAAAAGLGVAAGAVDARKLTRGVRVPLDLTRPADNVTAYLKMRASTVTQDVYFWFKGRLDIAVPGEPIRPIVDVETCILRRTELVGTLQWNVIDWEASLYRHPDTGAYLTAGESILNPHTGRMVQPAPYREGPVRFRFSEMEPRIIGSRDVMPKTGKPFSYPWKIVGDDIWMTKSSYIKAPNFLDPREWPLESSGKELIVATHSTLRSRLSDVENSAIASAACDFSYTATSSWLPWMQMGPTPGHVIWAEAGRKLFSMDEIPAEQLQGLRQAHPKWFERPEPWPEFTNMYLQYRERHSRSSTEPKPAS